MAFTTTANLGLRKADPNDFYDVGVIENYNLDVLDLAVGPGGGSIAALIVTSSTRPSAPVPGMIIYETDTRRTWLYSTAWRQIAGPRIPITLTYASTITTDCLLGSRFRATLTADAQLAIPTNPVEGMDAIWEITASGGARLLSLQAGVGGFVFGSDITALTATVSGKTDVIGCTYHGPSQRWRVMSYSKGF